MGGGGSKKVQTSESKTQAPDWAQKIKQKAAEDAQRAHQRGDYDKVAGLNRDQNRAAAMVREQDGLSKSYMQSARDASGNIKADYNKAKGLTADYNKSMGLLGKTYQNKSDAAGQRIEDISSAGAQEAAQYDSVYQDASAGQGMFGGEHYGTVNDQLRPMIDREVSQALASQSTGFAQAGALGGARAQAAQGRAAGDVAAGMTAQEVAAQRSGAFQGAQAGQDSAYNKANLQMGGVSNNLQAIQQGLQGRMGAMTQGVDTQVGQLNQARGAYGDALAAQRSGMDARGAAAAQLGQSGSLQQQQKQAELDAKYMGTQRLFGLMNPENTGQQTNTTTTGGGK